MRSATACLAIGLSLGLAVESVAATLLRRHALDHGVARAAAKARVGRHLGRLIDALDDLLDTAGFSPLLRTQAAHARLAQQADRLERQGDPLGALLLRDFTEQAPLSSFFGPDEDFMSGLFRGASEPTTTAADVSEEMRVETDSQGRTVTTTVHCERGNCTKSSKVSEAGESGENPLQATGELSMALPDSRNAIQGVDEAVQDFAGDMKELMSSMGMDGLHNVFSDIFKAPASQMVMPAVNGSELANSSELANDLQASAADVGEDSMVGSIGKALQQLAPTMGDMMGKVLHDMLGESRANMTNSSTVTRIENGKVFQETTRCENGHCARETHEEDLPSEPSSALTAMPF